MKNLFRKKINYNYSSNVSSTDASEQINDRSSRGNGLHFFAAKLKGFKGIGKKNSDDNRSSIGLGRKLKGYILNKNLIAIVITVIAGMYLLPRLFSQTPTGTTEEKRISVKPARASKELNRVFKFPLRDENNEQIAELEYEITKVELMDELVVQGKRATAVEGRTFLIISLQVKNDLNQSIEINTKDYVRLAVNGNNDDWLAPDIHNDPVKVQAISTKNTRLGFPINITDKDLVLRVGEIKGEKEEVPIEF